MQCSYYNTVPPIDLAGPGAKFQKGDSILKFLFIKILLEQNYFVIIIFGSKLALYNVDCNLWPPYEEQGKILHSVVPPYWLLL